LGIIATYRGSVYSCGWLTQQRLFTLPVVYDRRASGSGVSVTFTAVLEQGDFTPPIRCNAPLITLAILLLALADKLTPFTCGLACY